MVKIVRPKYLLFRDNSTQQQIIMENYEIVVSGSKIIALGKSGTHEFQDPEITELQHHLVMPGLINTHNHTAMTIFRGFADDFILKEWLENHIWPMEAKLNEDIVYAGAKFAAIESILSGTTTINSMYWYPEGEIKAFVDVGVRLMVGPPVISGVSTMEQYKPLLSTHHGDYEGLIRISLNPHAPYTVTADEYVEINQYKNEFNEKYPEKPRLKVHTHLAESPGELNQIKNYANEMGFELPEKSVSTVQYLNDLGILDEDLIAAHVVECNSLDIEILKENMVGIATNVPSNMKLGNNIPNLDLMVHNYDKVGLGTDGPSSNNNLDVFEAMKLSALAIKSKRNDPTLLPAQKIIDLATIGGALTLGWEGIGELMVNNQADLIAIDLMKPHLRPITSHESILSHIVYSANGSDVSHSMINGKWKMKDRQLIDYELMEVIEEFDEITADFFSE